MLFFPDCTLFCLYAITLSSWGQKPEHRAKALLVCKGNKYQETNLPSCVQPTWHWHRNTHYHENAWNQLTWQGEVALLQGFVQGQYSSIDVQVEPGAVGRTSASVRAQVEVWALGVAIQHSVDLEDWRACRLTNIYRFNVLILREVQPSDSCTKKKWNNQVLFQDRQPSETQGNSVIFPLSKALW